MNEQRVAKWMATAVALVAFVTYSITMCRTVYWGDGIELTSVAPILGIPHPPGYPLFALLGKAFVQLPLGTIGFRLNLMSATMAMVLATLVAWIVWRLLPSLGLAAEPERAPVRALLAAGAGWTVAFSQTFWYQAGMTEVYLLNAAFFAGVLLLIVLALTDSNPRCFLAACLLTAIGFGNHQTVILLIPPLAVVGIWLLFMPRRMTDSRKDRPRLVDIPLRKQLFRLAGPALLLGILGMFIYAYLPLRAVRNPPLNWGDPSTARNFFWAVRGGEFRNVFLFKAAPHVPFSSRTYPYFLRRRVIEWLTWTADQFFDLPENQKPLRTVVGLLLVLVAALGWRTIARRSVVLAIVLPMVAVSDLAIAAIYNIPDIEGYFFPAHTILVICLFAALANLHRWTENRLLARKSTALAAMFLALPAVAWFQARSICDHSHYDAAERYGREVLDQLAPNAMILTRGDYDIEPLWYQQIVEHRRRDVVVFGSNFLATPGYAKYFEGRYDPPVEARFLKWTPYEADYFKILAGEIIAPNMDHRPLYSTWFDPRLGVAGDEIEIAVLRDSQTLAVPERIHFPAPVIYRLRKGGTQP